jgi:hypothetical protein
MPRIYSEKLTIKLSQSDYNKTGIALGTVCVRANLPATYVARAFGVTRMTIHSWFRGKPLRDKNRQLAEAFIKLVGDDIKAGALPARSMKQAKEYIEDMIGEKI